MSDRPQQVMRVFTRGLKLPTLVGKLSGWRIPGGPYTVTQFVGGGLVIVVGIAQADLLPWGWFTNRGAVLVAGVAAAVALRFVKVGGRDPLSASIALAGVLAAPAVGRLAGRTPVMPRPRRVRRTRSLWVLEQPAPPLTEGGAVQAPAPTQHQVVAQASSTSSTRRALSDVEAVLAGLATGGARTQHTSGPASTPALSGRS